MTENCSRLIFILGEHSGRSQQASQPQRDPRTRHKRPCLWRCGNDGWAQNLKKISWLEYLKRITFRQLFRLCKHVVYTARRSFIFIFLLFWKSRSLKQQQRCASKHTALYHSLYIRKDWKNWANWRKCAARFRRIWFIVLSSKYMNKSAAGFILGESLQVNGSQLPTYTTSKAVYHVC